jgi:hypothetical protein
MTRLDSIIQQALEEALAALAARARDMVFEAAQEALAARVKALLEEAGLEAPAQATPALAARAKAAQAQALEAQATPEATPAKAKARKRAKAEATPVPAHDLTTILEAAKAALARYDGVTTPKGKSLPEVLARRLRKTLEHAQGLGRGDLQALAARALALIQADPKGTAMASWQALAGRLGLPVPVAQGQE